MIKSKKKYYFQFQRAITPKLGNQELQFVRSAHQLMLFNICVKFPEDSLNGFQVIKRTLLNHKIYFQFQKTITPIIGNPELLFFAYLNYLPSAGRMTIG